MMRGVDPATRLAQLDDELSRHIGAVTTAAWNSPPGGNRAWDQTMAWYGVQPLPANERVGEAMGRNMVRGAVPREVTSVLEAIAVWLTRELEAISPHAGNDPRLFSLRHRCSSFVASESSRYEAAVMPNAPAASAGPSVGSIFSNASSTAALAPWAMVKIEPNAVLVCLNCGAPQQRPLNFVCKYCLKPIAG